MISNNDTNIQIAIVMGSKSDWSVMKHCTDTLKEFSIPHEARVLSAHRTPEALKDYIKTQSIAGVKVFIAAAGGAAHLAGVVAAHTLKPVLGVPMPNEVLSGMDSLLSTVQMPSGIPVATFAIGKAGAINAALFSIQILSLDNETKEADLLRHRTNSANKILNEKLN